MFAPAIGGAVLGVGIFSGLKVIMALGGLLLLWCPVPLFKSFLDNLRVLAIYLGI